MILSEQDEEEVLWANLRIALLASERLCVCDGLAGFYGEAVVSHGAPRCGQRVRTLRARGAGVPQCMHQRTAVELNNQRMVFRAPVLCGTVALMICALVLMLGCGEVLSGAPLWLTRRPQLPSRGRCAVVSRWPVDSRRPKVGMWPLSTFTAATTSTSRQ